MSCQQFEDIRNILTEAAQQTGFVRLSMQQGSWYVNFIFLVSMRIIVQKDVSTWKIVGKDTVDTSLPTKRSPAIGVYADDRFLLSLSIFEWIL
jgi:hypothetical protein